MPTTTLPDHDVYDREIVKDDPGTGTVTYTAGGITTGPLDAADPLADIKGYAALAAEPPADYPGEPVSRDPVRYFVLAVAGDGTLSPITRDVVSNKYYGLQVAVAAGNIPIITGIWQALVVIYSLTAPDQAGVHKHALQHGIPGI
jgi:hypothetical protein